MSGLSLAVYEVDPGARWVCVGRKFVELGEAAEVQISNGSPQRRTW
jgi:hypothetical protein